MVRYHPPLQFIAQDLLTRTRKWGRPEESRTLGKTGQEENSGKNGGLGYMCHLWPVRYTLEPPPPPLCSLEFFSDSAVCPRLVSNIPRDDFGAFSWPALCCLPGTGTVSLAWKMSPRWQVCCFASPHLAYQLSPITESWIWPFWTSILLPNIHKVWRIVIRLV